MTNPNTPATEAYEAPVIEELGSLNDLTEAMKILATNDGFTFQGQTVGNAS